MFDNIDDLYWQIIIADDSLLSGSSTCKIINQIISMRPAGFVLVEEVDWFSKMIDNNMQSNDPIVVTTEKLLKNVENIEQFDWFHFVFFGSENDAFAHTKDSYRDNIIYGTFTIRGVDNSYFYIYTKHDDIAQVIMDSYDCTEYRHGRISEMTIPY